MAGTDVLVVGAGPTGLALAAQLRAHGASVRIVDRRTSSERPSRALVVQPRTLEVLRPLGVTPELLARGDSDARARFHLGWRETTVTMSDAGLDDTPFPFLLVLRQADTEAVLRDHLERRGTAVEWGTELVACRQDTSGVSATLRSAGGREHVDVGYVAGCDGAGSTVRRVAGIPFVGGAYRQSVALADVTLDGQLPAEPLLAFVSVHGGLVLFAGGEYAPWRVITIRGRRERAAGPLTEARLAALVDRLTGGRLRVRDVAWMSDIPLQHRLAATFRAGRVVLAGDAAHVHSPAGARGMNTGIQDACNLGWKLALVARGVGDERLLDSYDTERRRVARTSLLLTHLIFFGEAADHPALRWVRGALAPLAVPAAVRMGPAVQLAVRIIGQLRVAYPAGDIAAEADPAPRGGPGAGARMPDMALRRDGAACRLHDVLARPGFHLLLCGPVDTWDEAVVACLRREFDGLLHVHRISAAPVAGGLQDPDRAVLRRLGARPVAQYLVRPDGHIGYRSAGSDLDALRRRLATWMPGRVTTATHP